VANYTSIGSSIVLPHRHLNCELSLSLQSRFYSTHKHNLCIEHTKSPQHTNQTERVSDKERERERLISAITIGSSCIALDRYMRGMELAIPNCTTFHSTLSYCNRIHLPSSSSSALICGGCPFVFYGQLPLLLRTLICHFPKLSN